MAIVLKLDHSALEFLLAGKDEQKVELQNTIVQEFARKHLKAIVGEEQFKKFCQKLESDFKDYLKSLALQEGFKLKTTWGSSAIEGLSPDLANHVRMIICESLRVLIGEEMERQMKDIKKDISGLVSARITLTLNKEIDLKVREQVQKIIQSLHKVS